MHSHFPERTKVTRRECSHSPLCTRSLPKSTCLMRPLHKDPSAFLFHLKNLLVPFEGQSRHLSWGPIPFHFLGNPPSSCNSSPFLPSSHFTPSLISGSSVSIVNIFNCQEYNKLLPGPIFFLSTTTSSLLLSTTKPTQKAVQTVTFSHL